MKVSWKSGFAALAVALTLTVLSNRGVADDAKKQPSPEEFGKALAEAAKPGPEHAKLQPLAGNWTYTAKCWMDPSKPPIEMKGTVERNWILGGRFLEEKLSGTGFDGKPGFEGVGLLGYDNSQKKYVSTFACNCGTGVWTATGELTSSGRFTFQTTCYCPVEKKSVHGRDLVRFEGEDRVVTESFKIEGSKEVKVMEIIAVRKK